MFSLGETDGEANSLKFQVPGPLAVVFMCLVEQCREFQP